jgi:hypothetical protein
MQVAITTTSIVTSVAFWHALCTGFAPISHYPLYLELGDTLLLLSLDGLKLA